MKSEIMGALVDPVTLEEAVGKVEQFIASGKPHHVVTLNAEILYRAQRDPELMKVILEADLVTPDGAGIVWASKRLGCPVPERVTGIDLMLALAKRAGEKGWRLFLYGAAPGVAEEAAKKLKAKNSGIRIAGTSHGYLNSGEQKQLIEKIKEAEPHILFVALGAPKQEFWINRNLEQLGVPVCMGVGGSFDVVAGKVRRAPVFMQRAGLEWLYRLIKEPRRFKRMLALPAFAVAVLIESMKQKMNKISQ
ncbi:MAG: WecB/TagA/CpsF family glycosyltransferase [Clostridia bacterium]|nr:WecB/TagA/CpsF family glycosyltransferase [Clostridia bacterium]